MRGVAIPVGVAPRYPDQGQGRAHLFQPGRAAHTTRAAVVGGLVIGATLLILLTRRVFKLGTASVWVYVVLIAACLFGLPVASGLVAVAAWTVRVIPTDEQASWSTHRN